MGDGKWDFDEQAVSWDKAPGRVALANDIAGAIMKLKILNPDMDVLEFGCGTGLLTIRLSPLVRSITGVDTSRGMLGFLEEKIEDRHLTNIKTQLLDPQESEFPEGGYHLIICSMTLHHVKETRHLIDRFYRVTLPRGYLCIADLDPDEGRFHGENDTVFHHGFDRKKLGQTLAEAGFEEIRDLTAAWVTKPVPGGAVDSFSVFLMTARKGEYHGTQ